MKILSAGDVGKIVVTAAPDAYFLPTDTRLALVTRKWFLGTFARSCRTFFRQLSVAGYVAEEWDCENFALSAMFWAHIAHAKMKGGTGAGIAVGRWHYFTRKQRMPHAISVAVTPGRKLIWMEPQTQTEAKLTTEEIRSCYFCEL